MPNVQVQNNENNLHVYYARNYDSSGVVEFKGGTTLVFYVQPNGAKHTTVIYALARCHENDGFDRKIGRDLARIRLEEAPTILSMDFPSAFLVSKDLEINSQGEAALRNYRLPSSKVILTMFANIILEHYAQELQNKAFQMLDSDMYDDLDLENEQILDSEHAEAIVKASTKFIPSLGSGASEHDLAS